MYKIAIVDDEETILSVLKRFLSQKYDVSTYSNPVEAYNDIKKNQFDLVLCDIMMPQLDGLSLLKKLRVDDCKVKIIMMTAFDTLDKALEAHKYGAKNYLKKPFSSLSDVESTIYKELTED